MSTGSVFLRVKWKYRPETFCLSLSPGDWDAARKEWPGSVRHLRGKGNPFLSFTTEGLVSQLGQGTLNVYKIPPTAHLHSLLLIRLHV